MAGSALTDPPAALVAEKPPAPAVATNPDSNPPIHTGVTPLQNPFAFQELVGLLLLPVNTELTIGNTANGTNATRTNSNLGSSLRRLHIPAPSAGHAPT
jgi:hypothetical protein